MGLGNPSGFSHKEKGSISPDAPVPLFRNYV
jgi:hypothetical protein